MSKKKLLILSSYGGYGHIAATQTLKRLLSDSYEITVAYPIKELKICKLPAGESFYNWLLSNNLNRLTNWIVKTLSPKLFQQREEKTERLITGHIQEKNADLLISTIPFVNYPASEAARKASIPFLLVTTDNDLTNWVYGLEKMEAKKVKITVGRDLETSKGALLQKSLSTNAIETWGLPLRPEFFQVVEKRQLRAQYEIPQSKHVVLIMMGGTGSKATKKFVEALVCRSLNLHVLVCAGRNRDLVKKLKGLSPATGNTVEVIPFTEKVHELLALSDLLITKPGPGTINEAYAFKLPILLDRTKTPLFWEKANIDLVLADGVGACIDNYMEAPDLVARYLLDEQTREKVERSYAMLEENSFSKQIGALVEEMVGEPSSGEVLLTSRNMTTVT